MSVEISPPELGFRRPFNHEVTQVLRLKNTHDQPMAFKVKTTAPKQYCVRPNSGSIEPNQEVEIQVLLQAMKEDPPLDAKCRDKFLVQSALVNGAVGNVSTIWPEIEKTAKESIKERKIRVVFLSEDMSESAHTPQHTSINSASNYENTPTHRSPSPTQYGSPAASGQQTKNEPRDDSFLGAASNSVTSAASTAQDTLQQQLEAARAKITELTSQADSSGLRQRKAGAVAQDASERVTTGTTGMGVQTQPSEGVPVQIVAALCLLSFLLAYFFF